MASSSAFFVLRALELNRAHPTTDEFRATCLVRLAELRLKQGQIPAAADLLEEAMTLGLPVVALALIASGPGQQMTFQSNQL